MPEIPEPPGGTEWDRMNTPMEEKGTHYETKPYQDCPECGEQQCCLLWHYYRGLITWRYQARWFCHVCRYAETVNKESGYIWQS